MRVTLIRVSALYARCFPQWQHCTRCVLVCVVMVTVVMSRRRLECDLTKFNVEIYSPLTPFDIIVASRSVLRSRLLWQATLKCRIINVHVLSKYFWTVSSGIKTFNNALLSLAKSLVVRQVFIYLFYLSRSILFWLWFGSWFIYSCICLTFIEIPLRVMGPRGVHYSGGLDSPPALR